MIKKIFFGMAILACLTSCKDDGQYCADPQTHPQSELITFGDGSGGEVPVIDLGALAEGQDSVQVCSITAPAISDGNYETTYYITLGENMYDITAEGYMSAEDLSDYVVTLYGKRPVEREVAASLTAWASNGTTTVKLNSSTFNVKVIPAAPFIDTAYYIVGSIDGWKCNRVEDYKMVNGGGDVYEDSKFSILLPSPGTGTAEIKVIPQSAFNADGTIANWDIALSAQSPVNEGHFDYANKGGNITFETSAEMSYYKIVFDLMEGTYTITAIKGTPAYYIVGAMQGWSTSDTSCGFYPTADKQYSYTTQFTGDANLKIWAADSFGNWDAAYGATSDGCQDASGSLINAGAGAIKCPEPGAYYTLALDFATNTYSWTKLANQTPTTYSAVGLIGDFNGWGGDLALTEVTPHNWYVKTTIATAGGLKFRANNNWDVNWGADADIEVKSYGTGEQNGSNITCPAGTYEVFLNDITGQFSFVAQ